MLGDKISGQRFWKKLTVRRYSIARSGLKNAALIARSASALANPMFSIWLIAFSASAPIVNAEGSLKAAGSPDRAPPAGVGVAGTAGVEVAAGAGAAGAGAAGAGAAGVDAGALAAGVEGAREAEAAGLGPWFYEYPLINLTV